MPRSNNTTKEAHIAALKALILQGRRGDVIQYGGPSTDVLLHTFVLTADVGNTGVIRWGDSNWDVTKPSMISMSRSKTVAEMATFIGKDVTINKVVCNRGATLYRVRDDLRQ